MSSLFHLPFHILFLDSSLSSSHPSSSSSFLSFLNLYRCFPLHSTLHSFPFFFLVFSSPLILPHLHPPSPSFLSSPFSPLRLHSSSTFSLLSPSSPLPVSSSSFLYLSSSLSSHLYVSFTPSLPPPLSTVLLCSFPSISLIPPLLIPSSPSPLL